MLTSPETVLMILGYGTNYSEYLPFITNLPVHIGNRIDSLVTSLNAIDTALNDAPLDSMAVKIDKLEVSYTQHLALLKQEASRILEEISALVMLPINYDRYQRKNPNQVRVSRKYNAVSYW